MLAGTWKEGRLVVEWREPYFEFWAPHHPPLLTVGSRTSTHLLWASMFVFLPVRVRESKELGVGGS